MPDDSPFLILPSPPLVASHLTRFAPPQSQSVSDGLNPAPQQSQAGRSDCREFSRGIHPAPGPESIRRISPPDSVPVAVTTFPSVCNTGARPSDPVRIARGADTEKFTRELGARHYIDSTTSDVSAALQKLGGARVILATVTDADAMSAAMGGLGYKGEFVILGVPGKPVQAAVLGLVLQRQSIRGWPTGTSIDSEDTLKFSEISGVLPLIEKYPLEQTSDADDRIISGYARFRVFRETEF
ncbi:zinc-binding dehydrogenase [Paludibaculum fermentans]|uniref:Zinc-binding dehydrogenase n=1 Tax=Paludibaculum fermentans TaxID=1473598 RepID=A0A7S7NVJ5_PALFE|nr:zinc-binding dehydrogenase [Paludibaculum fermentans]QOY90540.1 zinc-binding dehydrogenase [Paludibaculum fermentans]